MGKLEVYEDAATMYRWRMKARNGAIVAVSGEGYDNKFNAIRAAERMNARMSDPLLIVDLVPDRRRKS